MADEIDRLAGGLPPHQTPSGDPTDAPTDRWFGTIDIEPECIFELAVLATPRLWEKIGFASVPRPQVRISPRDRPDLLADGVGAKSSGRSHRRTSSRSSDTSPNSSDRARESTGGARFSSTPAR